MAVGDHLTRHLLTESPRSAQADHNPLRLKEMGMSFDKMLIYFFENGFFGKAPEISVMTESAVVVLPHFDNFLMAKRLAAFQTIERIRHAARIVERTEGIHLGVEAKATTDPTHLVGEAGAKKEQVVAIRDGWGNRGDRYFGG